MIGKGDKVCLTVEIYFTACKRCKRHISVQIRIPFGFPACKPDYDRGPLVVPFSSFRLPLAMSL
jgi:hypothetical protein